jgi:hypothetical protein
MLWKSMNVNTEKFGKILDQVLKKGYAFAPQLTFKPTSQELNQLLSGEKRTHIQDSQLHLKYSKKIEKFIIPELIKKVPKHLKKNIREKDLYNITKIVKPYEISESDRAHFDSHLFTLITPINIPKSSSKVNRGQLVVFHKLRKEPINELFNFIGKLYYFMLYSSPRKLQKLLNTKKYVELDFYDMVPVIFLGRQCLHYSMPFESNDNERHILLITHFFDPSPFWSIGKINRYIRNR